VQPVLNTYIYCCWCSKKSTVVSLQSTSSACIRSREDSVPVSLSPQYWLVYCDQCWRSRCVRDAQKYPGDDLRADIVFRHTANNTTRLRLLTCDICKTKQWAMTKPRDALHHD